MSTPKRKSQEIAASIAALQKTYLTEAHREFAAGLKDLFDRHPRLKAVSWSASDEYNDEGGSDYSSNHEDPRINGVCAYNDDEGDPEDGENLFALADKGDVDAKRAIEEVQTFLADFPKSFYEVQFGRGDVRVTAEGITSDND